MSQWIYISIISLIVLPTVLGFAFLNQIYTAYLHVYVLPELEQDFGFEAENEMISFGEESDETFIIRWVRPVGILAAAGFRSGDIPVGYEHGFETGFIQDLLSSRHSEPICMRVMNIHDGEDGNRKWRTTTLRYHDPVAKTDSFPETIIAESEDLPIRIDGTITPPQLIKKVETKFPEINIGKVTTTGVIILEGVITRTGDVTNVRLLRSVHHYQIKKPLPQ